MSEIDIDALVSRIRKDVVSDIRREMAEKARGLPSDTLGSLFERWDREVLRPQGRQSDRGDGVNVQSYIPLVLDLPFQPEDAEAVWCAQGQGEKGGLPCEACAKLEPLRTLRHIPISRLTPDVAEAWRRALKAAHKRRLSRVDHKRGLCRCGGAGPHAHYSAGTVDRIVGFLQGGISSHPKIGKRRNPLKGLPRENDVEQASRKGYFRDEPHFESFLTYCHPTLQEMLRLSVNNGGMRKAEVVKLQIHEVNWELAEIEFPRGARTKNRKGRRFPVRDEEMKILRRRKAAAEAVGSSYLFFNERRPTKKDPQPWRLPIPIRTVTAWMYSASRSWPGGELAADEFPVFHHTRHTWSTWGDIKGVSAEERAREGGWSDPRVQARYSKQTAEVISRSRRLLSRTVQEAVSERLEAEEATAARRGKGGAPPASSAA